MSYFVAVDIGCIECGESSAVLGVFTDKAQAEEVCNKAKKEQHENWTGEHHFDVYEVAALDAAVA